MDPAFTVLENMWKSLQPSLDFGVEMFPVIGGYGRINGIRLFLYQIES
jgi:hypothetical protein